MRQFVLVSQLPFPRLVSLLFARVFPSTGGAHPAATLASLPSPCLFLDLIFLSLSRLFSFPSSWAVLRLGHFSLRIGFLPRFDWFARLPLPRFSCRFSSRQRLCTCTCSLPQISSAGSTAYIIRVVCTSACQLFFYVSCMYVCMCTGLGSGRHPAFQ